MLTTPTHSNNNDDNNNTAQRQTQATTLIATLTPHSSPTSNHYTHTKQQSETIQENNDHYAKDRGRSREGREEKRGRIGGDSGPTDTNSAEQHSHSTHLTTESGRA